MLEIGMKVNVNSKFMSGTGIVLDISNTAYCPVQVEMDQPDEDGHKIFRFHHAEVNPVSKQDSASQATSTNKESYVAIKEKGKVTVYTTKEVDARFHSKQEKASNHFEQMEQEGQTSIFEFI